MNDGPNEPESPELSAIMDALMASAELIGGAGPTLQDIANEHSGITAQLASLNPVQTAAALGSLLTIPELQGNCLRLETLVHLALMVAEGRNKPTEAFVRSAFLGLADGFCGSMEDPSEDVFVGTVRTPRGNFRVLEGIWEGSAFYLERFLNVIEAMPSGGGYQELRESAYALLTLSDIVCERAGLKRHQLGAEMPAQRLTAKVLGILSAKTRRVRFSLQEIEKAGITLVSLSPFLFTPQNRNVLAAERLGASTLERRPLVREQDYVSLVLPTAVSAAIRYRVIERMDAAKMRTALERGIANEYAEHFSNMQLLGGRRGTAVDFKFTDHGALCSTTSVIDTGRYLNLIFFTDDLANFEQTGLAGANPSREKIGDSIKRLIDHAHELASARAGYIDGVSLIVGCGIGRGESIAFDRKNHKNWSVEFTSAYDLDTLSWTPGFKPLSLWRLLAARERVGALGAGLQNINGLLNLVAWARSLDGHVVPHGSLPDDFGGDEHKSFLMITQNSQRELRREVAIHHDERVIEDIEGGWIPVRLDRQSDFADDYAAPLYASDVANAEGWLMSAYLTANRAWWLELSMPEGTPGGFAYERWRLATVWLSRAAPIVDGLAALPSSPIKWRAVFEATSGGLRAETPERAYEEARAAITVAVNHTTNTITTTASPVFEDAIYHPENIAERALVDSLLEGILALAGASQDGRPSLLRTIVVSAQARYAHGFAARTFRDFVQHKLSRNVITIHKDDNAATRLGLGWSVRDRTLGGRLFGKDKTIPYINALVTRIEDGLCEDLRTLNREALLARLLLNHETAAYDRDRWKRTSAALLALHSDTASTLATIGGHEMELNAVFQATRILIEMAICESPLDGGREPGKLDISRLMAKAVLLFQLGGWSDAIKLDVMEPTIRITALGDVHAKLDYIDEIIEPHVRESNNVRVWDAVNNYAENLRQVEGAAFVSDLVELEFLDSWQDEFGTSLQDMRVMVDWLENRGIRFEEPVMHMKLSDFENVGTEAQTLTSETVAKLLNKMTMFERPSWHEVPEGFEDRDRQPWRFRRRLSRIRRPILKIGPQEDERFLVAPGMVRDSFIYIVTNYMRGDFPPYQLSRKMRSWAGREADARGSKFTQEVASAFRALGWEAETEVKITKILGRRLDRDYGDVDVLAWKPDGRILIIECKDVQFKKTYGEICEQLADFRGELRSNGKPDYLRRHLDRMDILTQQLSGVLSYLRLNESPPLESHLLFKNPVPMKYALQKLSKRVTVSVFDEIEDWA